MGASSSSNLNTSTTPAVGNTVGSSGPSPGPPNPVKKEPSSLSEDSSLSFASPASSSRSLRPYLTDVSTSPSGEGVLTLWKPTNSDILVRTISNVNPKMN